jgi:copper(I)-binding protein
METGKKILRGQEVMERVGELVIPVRGRLALALNGAHLMLMGLKEHSESWGQDQAHANLEAGGTELATELLVALIKP